MYQLSVIDNKVHYILDQLTSFNGDVDDNYIKVSLDKYAKVKAVDGKEVSVYKWRKLPENAYKILNQYI